MTTMQAPGAARTTVFRPTGGRFTKRLYYLAFDDPGRLFPRADGDLRLFGAQLSADMRTSPVADKFLPADGHEISPAAATSSPQN